MKRRSQWTLHLVILLCRQRVILLSAWISGCWHFAGAEKNYLAMMFHLKRLWQTGFGDLAVIMSSVMKNIVNQDRGSQMTQTLSKTFVSSWMFCSKSGFIMATLLPTQRTSQFLAQSDVKVLKPPHYSSDLAPCGFFCWPRSWKNSCGKRTSKLEVNSLLEWGNSWKWCWNRQLCSIFKIGFIEP